MPNVIPTAHNTCAVIVIYHPGQGFSERLGRVSAQFPLVIIISNSALTSVMITDYASFKNVNIISNPINLGIAAALNQGIVLAIQRGFEWVVTLDQDTAAASDMLATLLGIYPKSGGGNVLIGSNYWDVNKQRNFIRCINAEIGFQERKTLITSGTLVALSLFKDIGFFREDYFIDSVDHEFCLRARAIGCRILMSCRPIMEHSIGIHIEGIGQFRKLMAFNHPPTRKYYIARNTIATIKLYFLQEPLWSFRQMGRLLAELASIMVFENSKLSKITAFMVGVAHGVMGQMGSIEREWLNESR